MRDRVPLFALLASSLVFLVSLFLPWRDTTAPSAGTLSLGLLNLFSGGSAYGWIGMAGDVAVLLVIAVVLATVAALRRPRLAAHLPIAGLGVAIGYFAVAVAHEVHTVAGELAGGFTGKPPTPHTSWTYGFYLGVASAGIAGLSALAFRRRELLRPRRAADVAGVLGIGLLVSFLLPWVGFPVGNYSVHGIEFPPATIAALALLLGAGWLQGEAGRQWRLPSAIATVILTGGAASVVTFAGAHAYGMWIGIGFAVSLVALETVLAWPVRLPVMPRGLAAVRAGAAALLIVALFLPWEELRVTGQANDGWYSATGAAAGGLCLLLLAAPSFPALESYALDMVVAVAIFVSATGTAFRTSSFFYRDGYGAFVGIAAAGILLVTVLVPLRPVRVDRGRALMRAVPLAASVLCVAAAVVPLWFVVPETWRSQTLALSGVLVVPGVLLGLYLVHLWARQVRGRTPTGGRLTLVPLILLALPSLELIRFRNNTEAIWGPVILVGLSLLLAFYGWMEEDRGVEGLRVPDEIWRVDRLPDAES